MFPTGSNRHNRIWKIPDQFSSKRLLHSTLQRSLSLLLYLKYLKTLTRTQGRMMSEVEQVADDLQVWRTFRSNERLYIASDGGLSGNQGTFGWVIATAKHTLFKCGGPVDGPQDMQNSTHCELCEFASSLLLIAAVARNWGLRRCYGQLSCDFQSPQGKSSRQTNKDV